MLSYSLAHWAIVEGIWSCFICSSIIYGFLFFFFFTNNTKQIIWLDYICTLGSSCVPIYFSSIPSRPSFYCLSLTLLSVHLLLLQTRRSGCLRCFTVHFLVRRLSSVAPAILSRYNGAFSLTLIKVHLASKCCGPLNTDCTEKRKWKRQSRRWRRRERERDRWREREREREGIV